ncbi:MAG: efflux RND transporter periplasmic adaptor subunit [Bryobacteraceae bacterium]
MRGLLLLSMALPLGAADVVKVTRQAVERKLQLPGELLPYQSVAIHARVAGFVDQVHADVGSAVKKGDPLAALVAPELAAQRAEAEAKVQAIRSQRAEAEARAAAAGSLFDRLTKASSTPGVVAGNELVQAEKTMDAARAHERAIDASATAAEATVRTLRELEQYLAVSAPFDGVVTERLVHPGALAGPSTPMFRLEQNSRLRLVVSVPETAVAGMTRGARASFTVPAHPGETFHGVVARIPNSMDAKTRSMAVELDVANPGARLSPGMYASVEWAARSGRAGLLVPPTSVVTTTERTFVIRVKNGAAEWVTVKKVAPVGALVEVLGALGEGDTILRRASDEIREGSPIR